MFTAQGIDLEMEAGERSESYYSVLGVGCDSSFEEIRRAYRRLAMRWHPDRWASNPSLLGDAKRRFQKIHEAYSVLSDPAKRQVYDAGLYDPRDEDDEGFSDFMQEMLDLMAQVKEEEKCSSLEDLQNMFWELTRSFETPAQGWHSASQSIGCSSATGRTAHRSGKQAADMEVYGMSSYCR